MTSVRLILLRWIQRVVDKTTKYAVKHLGAGERHAETVRNANYAIVVGVPNPRSEGDLNHAIAVAQLRNYVDKINASGLVNQIPPVGTNGDLATGFNNNLVGHNYISPENAKALGEQGMNTLNLNIQKYEADLREANRLNSHFGQNLSKSRGRK